MGGDTDLLAQVASTLERMGVPYMIGGSVALSAWAAPRTTHDVDIVVDLPEDRIAEFCSYFPREQFYIDADMMLAAFRQASRPGMGMYSFLEMDTGAKVDLFPLRPDDMAQQTALRRRVKAEVSEGVSAAVYAPDDLLVQKLRWYAMSDSERQFHDCINLVLADHKRRTPLIDLSYVEGWAVQLGPSVEAAWRRVKATVDEVPL